MTERWRRSLDALGRSEPDAGDLRERALRGRRLPDPPRRKGSGLIAGVLSVALAVASFSVLRSAFDEGSETPSPVPSDAGASALIPATICNVPAYDPGVALLGDDSSSVFGAMGPREVPLEVLDSLGAEASSIAGPAADALRSYLADPQAVYAPADGWRPIIEGPSEVIFAAPPDGGYSDWWVTRFTMNGGTWKPRETELVDQHLTAAQAGHGLHLDWTGEVVFLDGAWSSSLSLVNGRNEPWAGEDAPEIQGLARVFDRTTGKEIGHVAEAVGGWGAAPDLVPGAALQIPLSLGGSLSDLVAHTTYDIVACVPQLGIASPVGSLSVVENNTVRWVRVLTYSYTGIGMDALAVGRLVVYDGCLAIADAPDDPRPTHVIWPDGYALVDRNGENVLIDPVGREISRLGDMVQLGGGGVALEHAAPATIGGIPVACRTGGESYFLTSGIAGG